MRDKEREPKRWMLRSRASSRFGPQPWYQHIIGSRWPWTAHSAPLLAVFVTFLVSGLMHELLIYYLTRVNPTWEVTCFFIVQGMSMVVEFVLKRKVMTERWRLHRAVSTPVTKGFWVGTSFWLFFPQLLRNGVYDKAIREYSTVVQELSSILYFRKLTQSYHSLLIEL